MLAIVLLENGLIAHSVEEAVWAVEFRLFSASFRLFREASLYFLTSFP